MPDVLSPLDFSEAVYLRGSRAATRQYAQGQPFRFRATL